jgi:hypothetical protein
MEDKIRNKLYGMIMVRNHVYPMEKDKQVMLKKLI